jgi:hypothetical protein
MHLDVQRLAQKGVSRGSFRIAGDIIYGAMDNTEQRWLVVFVCPCPNCGMSRVEYIFLGFLPQNESIKDLKLGNLPCERCHFRWQPDARKSLVSLHPQILKKDFQIYTSDK